MAAIGADLMVDTLRGLESGTFISSHRSCQSYAGADLQKEDGKVDFQSTARKSERLRGFQPWPGSYTSFRGRISILGGAANRARRGGKVNYW